MSFYTYILQSVTSNKLYIGQTQNLDQRFVDHNSNSSLYTKFKGPWKIVFFREFSTRSEAVFFETYLKKLKNPKYILNNIDKLKNFPVKP